MIPALVAGSILSAALWLFLLASEWKLLGDRTAPAPETRKLPPISILRPLKGGDASLEANLESFYRQDYPEIEFIFSFASGADPALPIARAVADRHPNVPTAFVVDEREPGANPKVSRLLAALTRARHDHVLIADGDVRVSRDYLRRTAAEFSDPSVGLVSNAILGVAGRSAGARIESLHLNAFNLAGTAAVSRVLHRPCVVGKSMLLSRDALARSGGFAAVKDFLAEDYRMGAAVFEKGFRVVLSSCFVTVDSGEKRFRAFWDRHVRWARMRRRLAGPAYLAEAFASPLPWTLALAAATGIRGAVAFAAAAAVKIAAERAVLRRLGIRAKRGDSALIVVKDFVAFGIFWAGLLSSRTHWRGRRVRIGRGTLLLVNSAS